jgi:predicted nucleic acid-binding protein
VTGRISAAEAGARSHRPCSRRRSALAVACEFIAASRKRSAQGFTAADAWNRLAELHALFPLIQPSAAALPHAREFHLSRGMSFWDAMILGACVDAKVEILYTEDLPAASIASPRLINPFV